MSIDRERFENAAEEELRSASVPEQVLGFLVSNADQAFTAREISSRIDPGRDAISTALTRLKKRGLVEHKADYWAATRDEDRLREYEGYERATRLFKDQLGSENEDEWAEHAPDHPHPSKRDR
jgi:hypothetical protein